MKPSVQRVKTLMILFFLALLVVLVYRAIGVVKRQKGFEETFELAVQHIQDPVDSSFTPVWEYDLPQKPTLMDGQSLLSEWNFNGLSFFEFEETERFFFEQVNESEDSFNLQPPRDLYGLFSRSGIKLEWKGYSPNREVIRKLEGNPLLELRYTIYRWTKGRKPEVVTVLPVKQEEFLDTSISPTQEEYYYSVLLTLEGSTVKGKVLLESAQSEIISVVSNDRFTVRVVGGDEVEVILSVAIFEKGKTVTELFRVGVDEPIGFPKETANMGLLDFSTNLTLKAIKLIEEERKVPVKVPVFNSDGSVTIDLTTQLPRYREHSEFRPSLVITIECLDQKGRVRIFKES